MFLLLKSVNTLLTDQANFVIVAELRHKIQNMRDRKYVKV